mmetsp:Transcript_87593/g.187924  ORF Transcript_87593/g.187924 Transcript_87593/m.187924 type:complete len:201 (-) Transcript_87593:1117-1719(-)
MLGLLCCRSCRLDCLCAGGFKLSAMLVTELLQALVEGGLSHLQTLLERTGSTPLRLKVALQLLTELIERRSFAGLATFPLSELSRLLKQTLPLCSDTIEAPTKLLTLLPLPRQVRITRAELFLPSLGGTHLLGLKFSPGCGLLGAELSLEGLQLRQQFLLAPLLEFRSQLALLLLKLQSRILLGLLTLLRELRGRVGRLG